MSSSEEWRENNRAIKNRRRRNKVSSINLLTEKGITFSKFNNGTHLVVTHEGKMIDFWPSTGAWRYRHTSDTETHRGVFEMLKSLGVEVNGNRKRPTSQ